jgi:hypothetical protein
MCCFFCEKCWASKTWGLEFRVRCVVGSFPLVDGEMKYDGERLGASDKGHARRRATDPEYQIGRTVTVRSAHLMLENQSLTSRFHCVR